MGIITEIDDISDPPEDLKSRAEALRGKALPVMAFHKIEPSTARVCENCFLCGKPIEYVVVLSPPKGELGFSLDPDTNDQVVLAQRVFVGADCAGLLTDGESMPERMVLRLRQKVEWWKRTLDHGGIAKVTPEDVERWEARR